jgi:hypothetical protein
MKGLSERLTLLKIELSLLKKEGTRPEREFDWRKSSLRE